MPSRMTDTEALMWSVEQNPQLRSTMGAIVLLEGRPDIARLRTTVTHALAVVPALRERVQPSGIPLVPPERVLDLDLDLDHHIREVRLPPPASFAALEQLAARLINDPFDRDRPLWQMTVVSGLPRRRSAVIVKLHHSIADGQGALELAAHLLEFEPDAPAPTPLSARDVIDTLAAEAPLDPRPATLSDSLRFGAERIAGFLNEAANAFANPQKAAEAGAAARHLADQLPVPADGMQSPLWTKRSGNRRLVTYATSFSAVREAGRTRGLSLNELFVSACVDAAVRQHDRAGVDIPQLQTSVVVSTRADGDDAETNSFVPVAVSVPGTGAQLDDRLGEIRRQVQAKRDDVNATAEALSTFGVVANLLPASVAASIALQQTRRIDIATSNLPGPDLPLWIASQRVQSLRPVGPVGGTAFNATMLTLGDEAAFGLHIDPATGIVADELRDDLRVGLQNLGVKGLAR